MARSNLFALILIILVAFNYRHQIQSWLSPVKVPADLISKSNCQSKKYCAVVYLAPWCPACKQIEPLLKEILPRMEKNQEAGLIVLMGAENAPGQNEKAAGEISSQVVIDQGNSIGKSLKISYFPTIMVLDEKQKLLVKDQEALSWMVNQSR